MIRSLTASLALALAGCNLVFGLEEAEPRADAAGVGASGAGGDGGSTSTSTGGPGSTTSSTGGGGPTTGTGGGEGGSSAVTTSSTSTGGGGGDGGGQPCPVVHQLVETFEDADPTWEELYGSFSLILDEERGGSILRVTFDGTAEMRSWPFDPPWSLQEGDTVELSARSRGVEGSFTSASLSIGDGDSQGFAHSLQLARTAEMTPTSRVMTAESTIEDARVWLEVGALAEALFDVDDVIVRIRRCP